MICTYFYINFIFLYIRSNRTKICGPLKIRCWVLSWLFWETLNPPKVFFFFKWRLSISEECSRAKRVGQFRPKLVSSHISMFFSIFWKLWEYQLWVQNTKFQFLKSAETIRLNVSETNNVVVHLPNRLYGVFGDNSQTSIIGKLASNAFSLRPSSLHTSKIWSKSLEPILRKSSVCIFFW